MIRYFRRHNTSHRIAPAALAFCGIASFALCKACSAGPREDAFYHQLLKTQIAEGYRPTRSFNIVVDTEHGNQMVAEDEPDLRFNLLWIEQFQPGYRARQGGAALGELVRSYLRSAYKSYRSSNAQTLSAFPDENGTLKARGISNDLDYHINWTGSDFKLSVKYSY